MRSLLIAACVPVLGSPYLLAAEDESQASLPHARVTAFLDQHCYECHDEDVQKGDLDLTVLGNDLSAPSNFLGWSQVFERVEKGEMPPEKKPRPESSDLDPFLESLESGLIAVETHYRRTSGRSPVRRLGRLEYQNTLREILDLPHLEVVDSLPPEGSAYGYDKSAEALDFSHVHASRLMEVADTALRQAIAPVPRRPKSEIKRFEVRDPENFQRNLNGFAALLRQSRAIPLNGMEIDTTVDLVKGDFNARFPGSITDKEPFFDALALFINGEFNLGLTIKPLKPTVAGYYKIRVNGFGVLNDHGELVPSDRSETVGLYSHDRALGFVDLPAYEPTTAEITVWLEPDDVIKPLVASAPFDKVMVGSNTKPRQPIPEAKKVFRKFKANGVAFRWFELEGPLIDTWPPESHQRLFGNLKVETGSRTVGQGRNQETEHYVADVTPDDLNADSRRLMRAFLVRALRRPVVPEDMKIPMQMVNQKLRRGESFMEAMISGYRAVLTSPDFLLMSGTPGELDDGALAERLAYFLWDSPPDQALRNLVRTGTLNDEKILRNQVERMLNDPRSERFISHFLDKWLKLEDIDLTEPDANLYPDYTPLLKDSALWESRAYFAEMIRENLGARHIVDSDFVMINARLAELYEIPGVSGNHIRKVKLPPDSVRGGFLTQASLLKTTANGTVTSPVVRGDYLMTHLLGDPPPPPPPSVPAVEPDISGATTIREQLAKHREVESCAACHLKIDPPGFALESFDVMGGYRERYRSLGQGDLLNLVIDGKPAQTRAGLPVDASGELPDGGAFNNIHEFRQLLVKKEDQIGRHLLEELIVYATGAPVSFADRRITDDLAAKAAKKDYGVRTLIHLIVQSPLFREK